MRGENKGESPNGIDKKSQRDANQSQSTSKKGYPKGEITQKTLPPSSPCDAAIIGQRCRHHRATIQPSAGNGGGSSKPGIVRPLGYARDERIFHSFDQAHGIKPPFIWQSQEKNITLQNKQEGNRT